MILGHDFMSDELQPDCIFDPSNETFEASIYSALDFKAF